MARKVSSTAGTPTIPELKCSKTIIECIGGVGGTTLTRADLVALLVANGITSPNGNPSPDILGLEILVQPKGNDAYDDVLGQLVKANGATVEVTENTETTAINGGGSEYHGGDLKDVDCDLAPDDILAADFSIFIPEGSVVKKSFQVY